MVSARAFVVTDPGEKAGVRVIEVDEPLAGEVLVRMVASGVCATDAHIVQGTSRPPMMPAVLGHEGAGIVERLGAGIVDLAVGDQVVFGRSAPCRDCPACDRGLLTDCDSDVFRRRLLGIDDKGTTRVSVDGVQAYPLYGGTLSEHMVARRDHLVRVDADLPLDLLCLLGCAAVTGVGAVVNLGHVDVGSAVLVVGCGGIGLNVIQASRIAGATTIIAVDVAEEKLELAGRLGATHTVDGTDPFGDAIERIVPGGVDVAFEVVGNVRLVVRCLESTRVGGVTVMVGIPPGDAEIPVPPRSLLHNRRLIGCRGGSALPSRDIPRLCDLYRSGQLQLEPLVGAYLSLDEIDRAFTGLEHGAVGRCIVRF